MTKRRRARQSWDVVIVGAGPAGLSAALVLGRCTRNVLICDRGTPRSWASKAMHGFITRDGVPPGEFQRLAHKELKRYKTVHFWRGEVADAVSRPAGGFDVLVGKAIVHSRKLLLATGVMDRLPGIEGLLELFGRASFNALTATGGKFATSRSRLTERNGAEWRWHGL